MNKSDKFFSTPLLILRAPEIYFHNHKIIEQDTIIDLFAIEVSARPSKRSLKNKRIWGLVR